MSLDEAGRPKYLTDGWRDGENFKVIKPVESDLMEL